MFVNHLNLNLIQYFNMKRSYYVKYIVDRWLDNMATHRLLCLLLMY